MTKAKRKENTPDEKEAIALSRKISGFVLTVAKKRGMSQGAVADAMGYSRSSFCQMLNSKDESRLWRLTTLCSVSRVLGMKVEELFAAAARWTEQEDLGMATLWVVTVGTEPRSVERLQEIIYEVMERNADQSGVRLFEIGCKRFVADYRAGKLSDKDALRLLRQAEDERLAEEDEAKRLPLWAALAEMYGDGKND